MDWGKAQITKQVTSSILQGHSIKQMSDALQTNIPTMERNSAIRAARTAMTAAQNAGRMDSYAAAEDMGIDLKKQWLATLDKRTRHEHAMLDGQSVKQDEPFKVLGEEIMFPGDPNASPHMVYNCRCTLVADIPGVPDSAQRRAIDPETGESVLVDNMTYAEWAGWKEANGQSTGDETTDASTPELIDTINFANKSSVMAQIEKAELETAGFDYEVNYSITTDGKVWRVNGEAGSVNPSAIPSDLTGSYSYHNHPDAKTHYSFSANDVAYSIEHKEAYSKASDSTFEYTMKRTAQTVDKSPEEVYYRFKEIEKNEVLEMEWNGKIDPDLDGYHETMKILSAELKIDYERKKRN